MNDDFPYVTIPEHLKSVIGEPDPGTRTYRAYGTDEDMEKWFDAVWEVCAPDMGLSPGGVAALVHVSRAGVHKRIKDGRLTILCFHVVESSKWIKGRPVLKEGKRPYGFIPVVECRAWARQLEKIRDKKILDMEIDGDGDWDADNLDAPKNWRDTLKKKK